MASTIYEVFDLNEDYGNVGVVNRDFNLNETPEEAENAEEQIDQQVDRIQMNVVFQNAVNLFEHDIGLLSEICAPAVGMTFLGGSEHAAFVYTYAYKTGFEILCRTSNPLDEYKGKKEPKNNGENNGNSGSRKNVESKEIKFYEKKRIRFLCTKGSVTNHSSSNVTGCKFYVDARIPQYCSEFKITCCNLEHNHPIHPEMRSKMVSFRYMSDYFKKRMVLNDAAGISIANNYNSIVIECGGHENIPFNRRDARNAINIERRRTRLGGDAAAVVEYFEEMKAQDSNFFYAYTVDDKDKLENLFWADARQRCMYKSFSDAVTFDTTFMTNRYRMPLAPFVGVNHHGNSVVLAAALVQREDAPTFEWIFRNLIDCMGNPPSLILTDQCRAIGSAIRTVFGANFPHRLCLWHIMQNAYKNLRGLKAWKKIEEELQMAVHDTLEANEFEDLWNVMVEKYNLEENGWIKESYEIRDKWVPAYWKGTFSAGMSSTQRSEQMNRLLKISFSVETGLRQMIGQFEDTLKAKAEEERIANYKCIDRPAKVIGELIIEQVFQKLYTKTIFKEFQDEIIGLIRTNTLSIDRMGTKTRIVTDETIVNPPWKRGRKQFEVNIDKSTMEFTCSCKLFEFKGLLCRHIIRGMVSEDINNVPDKYILDRWKQGLVRGYEHIRVGYYDPQESLRVKKSMEITMKNDYVGKLAMHSDDAFAIYESGMADLKKQLEDHVGVDTIRSLGTGAETLTVWGRRRLQRSENNLRHLSRNAAVPADGQIQDPVDRRGNGRAQKVRQPNYKKKTNADSPSKRTTQSQRSTPAKRTRADTLRLGI